MSKHLTFTVTLRKVTTGYKVAAFLCDDMNHAYSMAAVLIKSQEYCRCYAVGVDWQGNQAFVVNPVEECAPPPVAMPQVQHQPQPAYVPQFAPQQASYPQALPAYYAPPPAQVQAYHPQQQARPVPGPYGIRPVYPQQPAPSPQPQHPQFDSYAPNPVPMLGSGSRR